MTDRTAPTGYLSVNDAADRLSVTPWEVLGLADRGDLETVTLVDAASLARYERKSA